MSILDFSVIFEHSGKLRDKIRILRFSLFYAMSMGTRNSQIKLEVTWPQKNLNCKLIPMQWLLCNLLTYLCAYYLRLRLQ